MRNIFSSEEGKKVWFCYVQSTRLFRNVEYYTFAMCGIQNNRNTKVKYYTSNQTFLLSLDSIVFQSGVFSQYSSWGHNTHVHTPPSPLPENHYSTQTPVAEKCGMEGNIEFPLTVPLSRTPHYACLASVL